MPPSPHPSPFVTALSAVPLDRFQEVIETGYALIPSVLSQQEGQSAWHVMAADFGRLLRATGTALLLAPAERPAQLELQAVWPPRESFPELPSEQLLDLFGRLNWSDRRVWSWPGPSASPTDEVGADAEAEIERLLFGT